MSQPIDSACLNVERTALEEKQAAQTITAEWDPIAPSPIDGVFIKDVKNVVFRGGTLTELYRPEWFNNEFEPRHIVHVLSLPSYTSQWHCHHAQNDIIFPIKGYIRVGFYDARKDSKTFGKSMVATFNILRPRYAFVPPGVWHSLKNVGTEEGAYVVVNDLPFDYENPDDWILPAGSPAIPVSLD